MSTNKRLLLIMGESGVGKTASLRDLADQEKVAYFNCESNKEVPFKNNMQCISITDPMELQDAVLDAEDNGMTIAIIDSLTFLLDMYESQYVYGAADGRKAWGDFQQFFKNFMQTVVAPSNMSFIFIAHVKTVWNEELQRNDIYVPVKGALKDLKLEAFFSISVMAMVKPIKELKKLDYDPELLTFSKAEEAVGIKHVFQTQKTKDTTGSTVRGPIGLWDINQAYVDNDAQMVLDIIEDFYEN